MHSHTAIKGGEFTLCRPCVCGRMVMNFSSNKHYPIMISNWILRGNFIFHITSTWLNTARFYPGKVRTEVVFSLTECVLQQLLRFIMGPSLVLFIRTLFMEFMEQYFKICSANGPLTALRRSSTCELCRTH